MIVPDLASQGLTNAVYLMSEPPDTAKKLNFLAICRVLSSYFSLVIDLCFWGKDVNLWMGVGGDQNTLASKFSPYRGSRK